MDVRSVRSRAYGLGFKVASRTKGLQRAAVGKRKFMFGCLREPCLFDDEPVASMGSKFKSNVAQNRVLCSGTDLQNSMLLCNNEPSKRRGQGSALLAEESLQGSALWSTGFKPKLFRVYIPFKPMQAAKHRDP